jgi:hypothetical protein
MYRVDAVVLEPHEAALFDRLGFSPKQWNERTIRRCQSFVQKRRRTLNAGDVDPKSRQEQYARLTKADALLVQMAELLGLRGPLERPPERPPRGSLPRL